MKLTCWSKEEREYLEKQKDDLKIESIIRLVQNNIFSTTIGSIRINEFGDLIYPKLTRPQFRFILEILTRDSHFLEEKGEDDFILSTRQEDKIKVKNYIEKIKNDLILKSIELSNAVEVIEEPNDITGGLEAPQFVDGDIITVKKKSRKWVRLLPIDTTLPSNYKKLESLISEAIKLEVKKYPYSASLLARSIFEITLKIWIKNKGLENELTSQYKGNAFDFNNLLSFSNKKIELLITDDQDAKKAVRQVINSLLTSQKEILNLTNHNDIHILSETEVLHIKDKLYTFCSYFLPRMVD